MSMSENACSWQHLCQQGNTPLQDKKEFSLESTAFRGQMKQSTLFLPFGVLNWFTNSGGEVGDFNDRNVFSHCPRGQNFKFPVLAGRSLLRLLPLACKLPSSPPCVLTQVPPLPVPVQSSLSYKNNDYLQAVDRNHPTPLPEISIQQILTEDLLFFRHCMRSWQISTQNNFILT